MDVQNLENPPVTPVNEQSWIDMKKYEWCVLMCALVFGLVIGTVPVMVVWVVASMVEAVQK